MMWPHTVTFQRYTEVSDGGGGYTQEWSDLLTTEAHVQPLGGSEFAQAQQLDNPVNHNIFYPYQEGVTASMRAYWHDRDKTLSIQTEPLDQGGMGEILLLKCELS